LSAHRVELWSGAWPSLEERPMPLSLSDDEYAAVQAAAAPIHPQQRDAFLKALAIEVERHPVVGPGLVHRLAADVQRRYVIAPERGTAAATREQLACQVWR
jgi:hypothetical protein